MAKQQKFTLKVNPKHTSTEKRAIAQDVIDHIIERTLKGNDKRDNPFKPYSGKNRSGKYSKSYVDSLDFKSAGKSKNKLNLQLSGDMLAFIEHLDSKRDEITIGFKRGSEENAKAEGNILGTYGNKSPVTKGRDFLGITQKKYKEILSNYPLRSKPGSELSAALIRELSVKQFLDTEAKAQEISERIGLEDVSGALDAS